MLELHCWCMRKGEGGRGINRGTERARVRESERYKYREWKRVRGRNTGRARE